MTRGRPPRSQSSATERKPTYLWNPEGFDPLTYLGASHRGWSDLARFLVHRVVWSNVFRGDDESVYVPLKAEYLRPFFPGNDVYTQVRDMLIEGGAIVSDRHYIPGEKCIGYKLGDRLDSERHRRITICDERLAEKIVKRQAEYLEGLTAVHRHLYDNLFSLRINDRAALEITSREEFIRGERDPGYATSIELIRDAQFRFHTDDFGHRVHTNLTSLPGTARKYLSVRGERLVNLDIRNSQPLLFASLLKGHYETFGGTDSVPEDAGKYVDLVQEGRFYDYLMEESGIDKDKRSAFKKKFFGNVFFCENWPVTDAARRFDRLFPNVHGVIRQMKELDYKALSRNLQRLESKIIIDGVATRCMAELPSVFIGTIHDSILTTEGDAKTIKSFMLDEFAKVGLTPSIQVEALL